MKRMWADIENGILTTLTWDGQATGSFWLELVKASQEGEEMWGGQKVRNMEAYNFLWMAEQEVG